jgi:hypothetical protein
MIRFPAPAFRRVAAVAAVFVMIGVVATLPTPALARVFVGVGIGGPWFGPAYLPPPYYYPPPMYYSPPPPVFYSPPQAYAPQSQFGPEGGQSCYAGPYVCPMDRPTASGSSCYCLGNGGQKVWGRAS